MIEDINAISFDCRLHAAFHAYRPDNDAFAEIDLQEFAASIREASNGCRGNNHA